MTSTVIYQGDLRTTATHLKSANQIITDAPVDNHGKGEAFSPTDLVATALASCMLTVMGIKAAGLEVNMYGASAEITKIMASDPRRIAEVRVLIKMPAALGDKHRKILEHTARTCPVTNSLSEKTVQAVEFIYE